MQGEFFGGSLRFSTWDMNLWISFLILIRHLGKLDPLPVLFYQTILPKVSILIVELGIEN